MGMLDGFFTAGDVSELTGRAISALERIAEAVEKLERHSTRQVIIEDPPRPRSRSDRDIR